MERKTRGKYGSKCCQEMEDEGQAVIDCDSDVSQEARWILGFVEIGNWGKVKVQASHRANHTPTLHESHTKDLGIKLWFLRIFH